MRDVMARLLRRKHTPHLPALARAPADTEGWQGPGYDWERSTAANCSQDEPENVGLFADVRASLDGGYHGSYTPARQRVQDSMIVDALGSGVPAANPWIVFTCGAMGAGKSHVMSWLARQGHFPLHAFVQLDADQFRAGLPEWRGYVERNPDTAGRLTQKECGYILEIAQEAALDADLNVWVDGSMRDHAWYAVVLDRIRETRPHYRIAIISVIASHKAVLRRTASRAEMTGRRVPHTEIMDSLRRTPETIAALGPKVDMLAIIRNEPGSLPDLASITFPSCTPSSRSIQVVDASAHVVDEAAETLETQSDSSGEGTPWCLLSSTFDNMFEQLPIYTFSPCSSTEGSRNGSPVRMRDASPCISPAFSPGFSPASSFVLSTPEHPGSALFEDGSRNHSGASTSSNFATGTRLSPVLSPRSQLRPPPLAQDTLPATVAQLSIFLEEQSRLVQHAECCASAVPA